MTEYILIVHGAWLNADGQKTESLYELPKDLTIKTYGLQNTSLSKKLASLIYDSINKNGRSLGLLHGENFINGEKVIYKEYKAGTQSAIISNYSIKGENDNLLGLFTVDPSRRILDLNKDYKSTLKNIIEENSITGILHLLCCQNFQ
jgi:hypothetical protein